MPGDDPKSRTNAGISSSSRFLWLLIGLALGAAFTNLALAIGGQHITILYQQKEHAYDQSPRERSELIEMPKESSPLVDNDKAQVYDGEFITKILKGDKTFPKDNRRLKYKPGTLRLSHAEAFQHCYVNTTHYGGHIADRPQSLVSVSDRYKLIYRNVPKSSSSSARHAMVDFFEGGDLWMKHDEMEEKVHGKNYNLISFIREPLNRFYSSYDEAYFRMGPWMGSGPIVRDKPRVQKQYFDNKYKVEKYSYLYAGFTEIEHFRRRYCPKEVLATGKFLDCNEIPSIDNGNLAHRFEQFVQDYSGLDPFDVHLHLQSSYLVFPTGEPFPITILYNATEAEKGWQEIGRQKRVEIPDGEMTHGRKITRRFNVSKVSDDTKRKICRILALDYCCFNFELPEVCRGNREEDEALHCAMEKRSTERMKFALEPFVIHPWRDP